MMVETVSLGGAVTPSNLVIAITFEVTVVKLYVGTNRAQREILDHCLSVDVHVVSC